MVLALAIGAVGGAVFAWLRMPLAWMMGAMCLTTVASLARAPIRVPTPLRQFMIAVLGIMLGSAFRPEMLDQAGQWGISLAGLFVYVAVVAAMVACYFRWVGRYDPTTAYFAAIPGGLSEMIMVGGASGGDERTIALTHASRILIVVLIIPFWFRLVEGYVPPPGGIGSAFPPFMDVPAYDLMVLTLCGVIGYPLARWIGAPAAPLTGPMVLSAIAHLTVMTSSRPPSELIIVAQVVIGSGIGCRFAGIALARVLRAIFVALGATAIMLGVGVAFSLVMGALTGLPVEALTLAYAPGGLAEMSLIALALGIDPALVSTHHVVRIFIVVLLAPFAFKVFMRYRDRRRDAARQPAKGD